MSLHSTSTQQVWAGFAAYTAHSPYEFEADAHYLKDSTGANVEHVAEEGGGGHGAHEGHEAHGDEHGVWPLRLTTPTTTSTTAIRSRRFHVDGRRWSQHP